MTIATALVVDQVTGDVFATSAEFSSLTGGAIRSGRLTVLETRQGGMHIAGSVAVGAGPSSVLIDDHAGRVLVLNGGEGDPSAGVTGSSVSVFDLKALETGSERDHALIRTTSLGQMRAYRMALDRTHGRLFIASATLPVSGASTEATKGSLSVLDTCSGAMLRTVVVGSAPRRSPWTRQRVRPSYCTAPKARAAC